MAFANGAIGTAVLDADFDAVVGRAVLSYNADLAGAASWICARLRPGGIAAFEESCLLPATLTQSGGDDPDGTAEEIASYMTRAIASLNSIGVNTNCGLDLSAAFRGAGLIPHGRAWLASQLPFGWRRDDPDTGWADDTARLLPSVALATGAIDAEEAARWHAALDRMDPSVFTLAAVMIGQAATRPVP